MPCIHFSHKRRNFNFIHEKKKPYNFAILSTTSNYWADKCAPFFQIPSMNNSLVNFISAVANFHFPRANGNLLFKKDSLRSYIEKSTKKPAILFGLTTAVIYPADTEKLFNSKKLTLKRQINTTKVWKMDSFISLIADWNLQLGNARL